MALVLGFAAFILLDPPLGAIALGVGGAIEVGEAYLWWLYLRRFKTKTGVEAMPGKRAEVVLACRPEGFVRLAGERWRAVCVEGEAEVGEAVEVVRVEGLELRVEPTGRSFYE
ncbi:MAG: NfeD family protein [Solirubrobacterales bacterium]